MPEDAGLFLTRRSRLSMEWSLVARAAAVMALLAVVIIGNWIDRDGLKDTADGQVSLLDVVYFTAVTITTVGYGDIVPVSPSARLFDTFVVAPVRVLVWLIFLGSAYSFFLERGWNRLRSAMIARTLANHVIVCGYGETGAAAVADLLRQGLDPQHVVVIDQDEERTAAAMTTGVVALVGDAAQQSVLAAARLDAARALLVTAGRDDATALIVLTARHGNRQVRISALVHSTDNEDLMRRAGADSIINPVNLGGQLLARAASHARAVDYLADLANADGRVELCERPVQPDEVGGPLSAVVGALGVRVLRDGQPIGFWEDGARELHRGDVIIEIRPVRR